MKLMKLILANLIILPLTFLISSVSFSNNDHSEWGYQGEAGPAHWGDLSSEFSTCKQGQKQSPIDIQSSIKKSLIKIDFHYYFTPVKILNNGHTIQVNYDPGSFIEIDGKKSELVQFHFHQPSEHTLNGIQYPMEVHLVHKNTEGQLTVLGILIQEGQKNDFIEALWPYLPKTKGETKVSGLDLHASALFPQNKSFYHYSGSLTTPPCSEGVNWYVFETPIEMSKEQIQHFQNIYQGNARPVQPLNGRQIDKN